MVRCHCLTLKGKQCSRDAKEGSIFCTQHQNCKKQIQATQSTIGRKRTKPKINLKTKTFIDFSKSIDIIIAGFILPDTKFKFFEIDDNYIEIGLRVDGQEKQKFKTNGFVTILPLEDFKLWLKKNKIYKFKDIDDFIGGDIVLSKNFIGKIEVDVQLLDGSYTDNFNFNDYIRNQFENEDFNVNVFINLPKGTSITEITDPSQL